MNGRLPAVPAVALMLAACSSGDRARALSEPIFGPDAGSIDAGGPDGTTLLDATLLDGPPAPDASGYCGNQFFSAVQDPPNLYFVLDRSGSMASASTSGSGFSRYTAVRIACVDVVRELGNRASVGAAIFPGYPEVDNCGVGHEVFATRPGDSPSAQDGGDGPVTVAFGAATNVDPMGGTPTSGTLSVLAPTLRAIAGKTVVILATDGGPNCNAESSCSTAECIWNIEHTNINGSPCMQDRNCCDPFMINGPGARGCLDAAPTIAAVQKLRDDGIRTYVVGIPGSGPYEGLLDQLAIVGGTARPQSPRYYRVDDMATLGDTLRTIGGKALTTCQFDLAQAPPDPNFVNVYLDGSLIAYDDTNGWTWLTEKKLALHGIPCAKLEDGEASQVQVVAGCPTEQPH